MQRSAFMVASTVVVLAPLLAYLIVEQSSVAVVVAVLGVIALLLPLLAPLRFEVERLKSAPPAPELLLLPLLVEGRLFTGSIITAGLLACLAAYLATMSPNRPGPRPWVLVGVGVTFALPFSRPIDAAYGWLIPLLCLTVLVMSSRRREFQTFVSSLVDGIGLYLIVNVMAYLAGVVSPAAALRTGGLEGSGGSLRVIFPIAGSLATPPAMAAIFVAAAAICLQRSGPAGLLFRLASLAAALFVLVRADTRAALLVAAVLLLVSIVSTRALARVALPITMLSAAFAFVFGFIQSVVGVVLTQLVAVFPRLSRGGAATDLTLNFRAVIWDRTLTFWSEADAFGRLFGYGIRGQQQSGASGLYAREIGGISADPRAASVHNSYLQQLFDAGLVGLVIFVVLLVWAVRRYAGALRARVPGAQLALPVLLAGVTTGITEVILAPGYGQAPVYIAMGLVLYASTLGRGGPAEAPPVADQGEVAVPLAAGVAGLRPVRPWPKPSNAERRPGSRA